MSDPTTYQRLAERFPAADHKTKTIGGTGLTYVDGETIVSRLNEVLGFDGWSFEIGRINVLEDEVWATGKLTVYSGDRTIVREQAGGQIINRKRGIPARAYVPAEDDRPEQPAVPAQKGEIVEISNDIKGAVTDCLKKCATLVGVGLYLYDPVERREVEAEMRGAKARPVKEPTPITTKTRDAAILTGANPAPGDPERKALLERFAKGVAYAKGMGLDPAAVDLDALNNAGLLSLIEDLLKQCQIVTTDRAAKQPAAS